jgi:hypothetical protein
MAMNQGGDMTQCAMGNLCSAEEVNGNDNTLSTEAERQTSPGVQGERAQAISRTGAALSTFTFSIIQQQTFTSIPDFHPSSIPDFHPSSTQSTYSKPTTTTTNNLHHALHQDRHSRYRRPRRR